MAKSAKPNLVNAADIRAGQRQFSHPWNANLHNCLEISLDLWWV